MKILVSACLLGINCKYNGGNNFSQKVYDLSLTHTLIPVCPECLGKLPTPREPSEIVDGKVMTKTGQNVDNQFRKGALDALQIALDEKVNCAVLQSRSPSCGVINIYDGTFTGVLKPGSGIFASLLMENGIRTIDVTEIDSLMG